MSYPVQQPTRIAERVLLRVLAGGFLLVVLLLGAAGFVAVRSARAIEDDAAQASREQLAVARLLNDVQDGQNSLAFILHQMAPGKQNALDRESSLRELEAADRALTRLAESSVRTPEVGLWLELRLKEREFTEAVRAALQRGVPDTPEEMRRLFDLHDRVVLVERKLLEASEKRLEGMEARIEMESRELASKARILLSACLSLAVACAFLTVNFARRSIRRIEWQASELSRVSWHMLQTQESAARRFSHELHDELGQALAAIKANLNAANPQDWLHRRADCLGLVDESIANVRELSQLLHPVILDDFGLSAGLKWLAERFTERTGIRTVYGANLDERLSAQAETHLFRIAQEALTNVARHSGASEVIVELTRKEDGAVQLVIEDNGRGLRPKSDREGPEQPSLGMTGMRARAREIGGEILMKSGHEGGLRLEVSAPRSALLLPDALTETEDEDTHPVG